MENDTGSALMTLADDSSVFEKVFKEHFKKLHAYACTIVRDTVTAEEMVQNVFCKLWERKERIQVTQSVTAYLYRSVYHESLNYLKHQKIKAAYESYATYTMNHESQPGGSNLRELEQRLEKVLSELPQQCRTIFQMSRFEDLKYREIADQLNISIKTVENQMGKALRILRLKLVDFLPLLLLLFNL